jgi:hypothetical protein
MAEDNQTSGPSGVKDLGGLVNKDIAFSKVPENVVYDSKNFRVTTDDGGTLAVRSNIKGTVATLTIPSVPCIQTVTLNIANFPTSFQINEDYEGQFQISGGNDIVYFYFTYTSYTQFFNDLLDFFQTNFTWQALDIIASGVAINGQITLQIPTCNTITFLGFTGPGGLGVTYPYTVQDSGFVLNNNTQQNIIYNNYYNYSLSNSYPSLGPLSDDFWNMDYIETPLTEFTWETSFTTGIFDSRIRTWYSHSARTLMYRDLDNPNTLKRTIIFNASAVNSASIPTSSYPGGDITVACSYAVGVLYPVGTAMPTKTIKIFAVIDGWTGGTETISPDPTVAGVSYPPMVKMHEQNIAPSSFGAANFVFALPPQNKIERYYIVVEVEKQAGTANLNIEFYLDRFDVSGPFINPNILTITPTSPGITSPILIGWTTLRDKTQDNIYLLTTNGTFNPDDSNTGPFTSYGQWWKFSYPKEGDYSDPNIYSINLIYNNQLDLTVHRPVANPGMIESRYENEFIQKIYWTDNYNVPRVINVADPNAASLTVDQLNLQPSLSMDMPLITEVIDGGVLSMGVYQVAYRLKNINGSETRFGRTSQLIPIIDAPEKDATVLSYYPYSPVLVTNTATTTTPVTNTNSTKAIRVNVSNINLNYDTIEFALIYYSNNTDIPLVDIVYSAYVPRNGQIDIIITGSEDKVPITIDELTAFTTNILTAKTLAAKKQTLFLGNVTLGTQVVDWDSRAYRFPINNVVTTIKDELNNSYSLQSSLDYKITQFIDPTGNTTAYPTPIDVPSNADCIQSYTDQNPNSDASYLYKPNSNILGGAGPNVSYEFVTETILLDNKYDTGGSLGVSGPHLTVDSYYTIVLDQNPYYKSRGTSVSNNASPYVYDMFVGYRRDEMERFGIVFFDELDNPTYVNWIADIRMPHIYMPDTTAGANLPNNGTRSRIGVDSPTFSSDIVSYIDTAPNSTQPVNRLYGKPLGIKFTIDFSDLPSKYKKASIVRVPKKDTDKHILGQGALMPTYKYDGGSTAAQDLTALFTTGPIPGNVDVTSGNNTWYDAWIFQSPEFLFTGNPAFVGNDEVDFVSFLDDLTATFTEEKAVGDFFLCSGPPSGFSVNSTFYLANRSKNYKPIESTTLPHFIKDSNSNNSYPLTNTYAITAGGADRRYLRGNVPATAGGVPARTINNCGPKQLSASFGGGASTGGFNQGYSYGNNSLLLQLDWVKAYDWLNNTGAGGGAYVVLDGWSNNYGGPMYLGNYKRTLANGVQFGGNTYFARASNEYIPCNNLIDISDKTNPITTKVFGGDTKITVMDYVYQFFDRAEGGLFGNDENTLAFSGKFFPVETSVAVDYRENYKNLNDGTTNTTSLVLNRAKLLGIPGGPYDSGWSTPRIASAEHFKVDPVYNHTDKGVYKYFPAPALGKISGLFDCRIWKSESKTDGELVESWSIFRPGAFKDVESAYGSINNLIIFQDKMYYFQDRAFGIAQVDEQKLVKSADTTISDLVLGSSGILERYDYISTKTGTKHQFSMSVSDYSIIWFDTLARKMYRYKGTGLSPISDIKGLNAFLYNKTAGELQISDNPYLYKGIHSTYDYRHNEFYTTFVTDDNNVGFTLVYNDLLDGFIGEYTHMPKVYINDKANIFSPDPFTTSPVSDVIYIHNYGDYGNFYGERPIVKSSISFIMNTGPNIEKVLNNLEVITEAYSINEEAAEYNPLAATDFYDFFDSMRIFNNYQNTGWQSLSTLSRKHKTVWNIKVPSDRTLDTTKNIFDPANLAVNRPRLTKRLKDKWFMVELEYNNSSNNKLVVHSAKGLFAINSR